MQRHLLGALSACTGRAAAVRRCTAQTPARTESAAPLPEQGRHAILRATIASARASLAATSAVVSATTAVAATAISPCAASAAAAAASMLRMPSQPHKALRAQRLPLAEMQRVRSYMSCTPAPRIARRDADAGRCSHWPCRPIARPRSRLAAASGTKAACDEAASFSGELPSSMTNSSTHMLGAVEQVAARPMATRESTPHPREKPAQGPSANIVSDDDATLPVSMLSSGLMYISRADIEAPLVLRSDGLAAVARDKIADLGRALHWEPRKRNLGPYACEQTWHENHQLAPAGTVGASPDADVLAASEGPDRRQPRPAVALGHAEPPSPAALSSGEYISHLPYAFLLKSLPTAQVPTVRSADFPAVPAVSCTTDGPNPTSVSSVMKRWVREERRVLMRCLLQQRFEDSWLLVRELVAAGQADVKTLNMFLHACMVRGEYRFGLDMFDWMRAHADQYPMVRPDESAYTVAIAILTVVGEMRSALHLIRDMERLHIRLRLKRLYTRLIQGYLHTGDFESALSLCEHLRDLRDSGLSDTAVTVPMALDDSVLVDLLQHAAASGSLAHAERALALFVTMRDELAPVSPQAAVELETHFKCGPRDRRFARVRRSADVAGVRACLAPHVALAADGSESTAAGNGGRRKLSYHSPAVAPIAAIGCRSRCWMPLSARNCLGSFGDTCCRAA